MEDLLTISEAAQRLGVHVDTLRRYEARGYLQPHYTEGGHRRYHLKELQSFVMIYNNPIGYFMQYHDLAKLPTHLMMHEHILLGGDVDFSRTEFMSISGLPTYQRLTDNLPERRHALEKKIILLNREENGLLPNLNFRGTYTKYWVDQSKEDSIIISMSQIWPDQQYCFSNRHGIAPDLIWGEEAERTPDGVSVRTVCYKRIGA